MAIALLPVAVTLALGVAEVARAPVYEFPCPIYPNGTVAITASFHESCPLRFPDSVSGAWIDGQRLALRGDAAIRAPLRAGRSVRYVIESPDAGEVEIDVAPARVQRAEAAARLAAATLLAASLTLSVLLATVRTRVRASLPFSLVHAAAGIGIVTTVAGWTSSAFEIPAALARAITAAALVHLALVFPQRRGLVELAPELLVLPYVAASALCGVELDAAYNGSAPSTAFALRLLMAGIGLAALALCAACSFAARDSRSHLARAQARVFLVGAASLLGPAALTWTLGSPEARLTAMTLVAALMPFPVGYAISRYQAYDLDSSIRRSIAHALYLSLWAGVSFLAFRLLGRDLPIPEPLRHPTVGFAAIYAALVPVDAARTLLRRRLDRLLVSQRVDWDRLGLEYSQRIAAQRTREDVADTACDAIRAGIPGSGVALLLCREEGLAPIRAHGVRGFPGASLARRLLSENHQPVIDMNRLDATRGAAAEAYAAGIEALARIESGDHLLGCIAIYPERRGRLLAASEQLWIATIAGHSASALLALRFEQELRVSRRFAARGRVETEIAHEIGKPLGVLELTARTLAEQIEPEDPLAPELAKIARLALTVREVAQGARVADEGQAVVKLTDLVQRALSEVRSIHGEGRVHVDELPELGELPSTHACLVRALVNLLDNALRASPAEASVDLRASTDGERILFQVADRGVGMSDEQLRRAFEPFASFRAGGTGIGLSITRRIAQSLGGNARLARRTGGGIEAFLEVPRTSPATRSAH